MKGLVNVLRVFTDPLVVFDASWGDAVPAPLRERIVVERLVSARSAGADGKVIEAVDSEVIAYLMTASLTVPLDGEWTRIYLHLCNRYVKDIAGEVPDFLREYESLSECELSQLRRLRVWIRGRQDRAFKQDGKTDSVVGAQCKLGEFA